jgi:trypsin
MLQKLLQTRVILFLIYSAISACRTPAPDSKPKVIGGIIAPKPYLFYANPVSLAQTNTDRIFCGGARISRNIVLTAAHCVSDIEDFGRLGVVLGLTDATKASVLPKIPVKQVVIHPEFDAKYLRNDIALLILEDHPRLDEIQEYMRLPKDSVEIPDGRMLKVIGFGTQSSFGELSDERSDRLNETLLPFISTPKCSNLLRKINASSNFTQIREDAIVPSQLCAGDSKNGLVDSCYGDSGGPLFQPISDDLNIFELVGIVSRSLGEMGCAVPGNAGLYTRVSSYLSWIEQTSEKIGKLKGSVDTATLASYQCYDLTTHLISTPQLLLKLSSRGQKAHAIRREEYERLKKLPAFGACDLKASYGVEATFVQDSSGEKAKLYAIFDDGNGVFEKVSYVPIEFKHIGGANYVNSRTEANPVTVTFTPDTGWLEVDIYGDKFGGEPFLGSFPKGIEEARKFDNLTFSSTILKSGLRKYYAEIKVGPHAPKKFELFESYGNGKITANFYPSKHLLRIENKLPDPVISWDIACEIPFKLRSPGGRIYISKLMISRNHSERHLVVFRAMEDSFGVIASQGKIDFDVLGKLHNCILSRAVKVGVK